MSHDTAQLSSMGLMCGQTTTGSRSTCAENEFNSISRMGEARNQLLSLDHLTKDALIQNKD